MKILIIGQPRCGSTVLMRALAKIYKCQTISEPWTENREKGKLPLNFYLPEKVIVKSMATQYPLDYSIKTPNGTIPSKNSITAHLSIIKKFDKIILIGRKKRKEQIESLSHAIRNFKTPDEWHKPYIFEEEKNEELLKSYNLNYEYSLNNLINLSTRLDQSIIWYEDLFSGDETIVYQCLSDMKMDIRYDDIKKFVDPKKKYRTFLPNKSII